MKYHFSLIVLLACLLQECSSTNVTTDYDRQADFTNRPVSWCNVLQQGRRLLPSV